MNACFFLEETQDTCPSTKIMTVLSELFWMSSAQQRSVLARQWDRIPRKAMEPPSLRYSKPNTGLPKPPALISTALSRRGKQRHQPTWFCNLSPKISKLKLSKILMWKVIRVKIKRCYIWSRYRKKTLSWKFWGKMRRDKSFINPCSAVIRAAICRSS